MKVRLLVKGLDIGPLQPRPRCSKQGQERGCFQRLKYESGEYARCDYVAQHNPAKVRKDERKETYRFTNQKDDGGALLKISVPAFVAACATSVIPACSKLKSGRGGGGCWGVSVDPGNGLGMRVQALGTSRAAG